MREKGNSESKRPRYLIHGKVISRKPVERGNIEIG
jgi:hypothetical protein